MSWQQLYGSCWDNQVGDGHTSSRRGIVSSVGLDCETNYGTCIKVKVGYINGEDEIEKPDLRVVKKGERDKVSKKYSEDVDKATKIHINIDLMEDKHFEYRINGINVNREMVEVMHTDAFKKALKEHKVLAGI